MLAKLDIAEEQLAKFYIFSLVESHWKYCYCQLRITVALSAGA